MSQSEVSKFVFARESARTMLGEGALLFEEHYKEIAHYQDIELNPAAEQYLVIDEQGALRVFSMRDSLTGELAGYAVFFVKHNMHYRESLQAVQDILFIAKKYRGQGREFIKWCDEQLKSEGVQVVYHHVKAQHNWGKMLEMMGYELVDLIFAKRLDK